MYLILFVMVAIGLGTLAWLSSTKTEVSQGAMEQLQAQTRVVAEQGAQVFFACSTQPVGTYAVADLITAGALPAGYAQTTAYGNAWICKVAGGGVNGSNVVLVGWDSPPIIAGRWGKGALSGTVLQTQVAWKVASLLAQQLASAQNIDEGVLQAGTSDVASAQTNVQYDVAGLISSPTYSTPVIEQGLSRSMSN